VVDIKYCCFLGCQAPLCFVDRGSGQPPPSTIKAHERCKPFFLARLVVTTEISKCVIEFYFTVSDFVFLRLLCDELTKLPNERRWKICHLECYNYHIRISFLLLLLF
jgi:hypothetical protein